MSVPTTSSESMQLVGMLQMCKSLVAAADNRPGDVDAPLVYAAELAERTGEGNAYGTGFGPTSVGLWRMYSCLDVGDYVQAVRIGDGCTRRCTSPRWCSRLLGHLRPGAGAVRGRRDDAVRALHRAEEISPYRVYRDLFATDVIAELIARSREDAGGRELRGMVHRAGLLR